MKTFRFGFALAACAAIFFAVARAAATDVTMIPESGELQPSSTLEFRFPAPAIKADQIGPAAQSPVVFTPELPGDFTWLSTSSGVFAPRGPLPLGSTWRASLRDGIPGNFSATVSTPPFSITRIAGAMGSNNDISPDIEVRIAFNLPVSSDASFFEFVNNEGLKVPATVRPAAPDDYFEVAPEEEDWNWRWKLATDPSAEREKGAAPSRIVVTPASLLPVSDGWKLAVKSGLPSAQGDAHLVASREIEIGNVSSLSVHDVECGNYVNSGPTATITFNKSLAPDITDETAGKFFNVTPEVPGVRWEISYDVVVVRGKFELGKNYSLRIGDDVVAADGTPFGGQREVPLSFKPVPPRLYLPELTIAQILAGRRILPVKSVNLLSLKLRAVRLPPEQALRALGAFADKAWQYSNGEPVPTESFSGETLADETIAIADPQVDKRVTTDLEWKRILGEAKAGFVYLELTGEPLAEVGGNKCAAQALVQLSDLGVLWSRAGDKINAFIFSAKTGQPVSGAKAQLFDEKFQPVTSATTDEKGSASLGFATIPQWLLVQADGDACALRMGPGAQTLPTGSWYSDWSASGTENESLTGMVFTDRPIYQPGETVRFKGFLRVSEDGQLRVAAHRATQARLLDPESNEIAKVSVTTDEGGALDGAFVLPAGPLGRYKVELGDEDEVFDTEASSSFIVAAYQPDAFEVDLSVPQKLPAGAPAPVAKVTGRYLFGGKVTDAEVRWSLRYFQTSFAPEGFDRFQFLADDEQEESFDGGKPLTLRGDNRIKAGTAVDISLPLPAPVLAPYRGVLTAEVTDLNQQTVSQTAEFTREASDFYLGISRGEERAVRIGEQIPLQVVAVQPDGSPLAKSIDVKVSISRNRYNVVRELGAGGAMKFSSQTIDEPMAEESARTVALHKEGEKWTAGDSTSLTFKPTALGRHRIRVTARDAGGREVVSESYFYVFGEGETVWDYRNPFEVDLVPDKQSYKDGEKARILVKTPINGEALVNVQRGDTILRTMRLPLSGNAPAVEIPLTGTDAPNVYVTLVILRGSDESRRKFPMPEFRFGSCMLSVEQPERLLDVAIRTAKDTVQPGEDVVSVVEVRDRLGKPVPGAGVTFYAIDDGVVSLVGFKRPDPADVFLQAVADRVLIGLNLADLLPEDPEDLTFANKGYLIGGGGQEGPVALRENFPGTACWLPSLSTGPDGRVTARFTAPDALTRYRLVAVAAAGADAFGSAESVVAISKPLMLLPSLGQFANEGDDLVARAVIRNDTGSDGDVEVALRTPAGSQTQKMSLANGSSAAADFPVAFAKPGDIDLEWTARMEAGGKSFSDGAKTRLPVGSPMVKLQETYFTELAGKTNNLLDGINPQLVEGRGNVAVTVANTRLVSLGQGARYLVEYPYGCAEQKTSSLVPWIVMPALGPLMPGFARDPQEIGRIIDKTVFELFQLQRPDGGLGFWPGSSESSLFASAWSGIVLSMVSAQEAQLPKEWSKLLDYLAKSLRGLSEDKTTAKLGDRAFAAYALALAGRPESAYHEELFRRRADLPRDARAVLAAAIAKSGGPREMSLKLLSEKEPAPDDTSPFADAARERAIRLAAVCLLDPKGKEIGPLVAEVLKLGSRNRAVTTQNSAWTLLALSAYRDGVENKQKGLRSAEGAVIAGAESVPFAVSNEKPAARSTFPIAPSIGAAQNLQVDNPSAAPLYGETSFEVYPPLGEQPRQDRGFAVSRSYRKIAGDGSLVPAENLRVGDRIVVTLRVESTRPAHFVVVDDPLPSILEAVNPEFVSRQSGESAGGDYNPWLSHSETRADRVVYFCDALPAGAHTFTYLARVRTAGKSAAGATKAEAMYRPERFGLGTIDSLASEPALTP